MLEAKQLDKLNDVGATHKGVCFNVKPGEIFSLMGAMVKFIGNPSI